jgi:hypothetical protein
VNPELGLVVEGERHIVKLYFKDEGLKKNQMDIISQLMEEALRPKAPHAELMSILDIRSGKLITRGVPVPGLKAILEAELAYVAALWPYIV